MKVTEIAYGRLINTGNFENERYELKASLDEDDDLEQVVRELKEQVVQLHRNGVGSTTTTSSPPSRRPPARPGRR